MKEKLAATLGGFGYFLFYLITVFLTFAPLTVLGLPWWIDATIILAVLSIPFLGSIVQVVIWVWSFVMAVQGPQDIWTILYYVAAAIYVFSTLIPFLTSTISTFVNSRS